MFDEKTIQNKVKITEHNSENEIKDLFAQTGADTTVTLRWMWPRDKRYKSAVVFELGDDVRADIDQIHNAVLTGKKVREYLAIREDFNFSFPIKASLRKSRFVVFPFYMDEEENMCVARQKNNITKQVVRSITVDCSAKVMTQSIKEKAFSIFKKSNAYKKVYLTFKDIDNIRNKEEIIYYKIKGDGRERTYCIDIDAIRNSEDMFFYIKGSEQIEFVSGPEQNIIFTDSSSH